MAQRCVEALFKKLHRRDYTRSPLFDKPVFIPAEGVRLTDSDGNLVLLARQYSFDPSQVIFAPQQGLRPNAAYSLSVSGAYDMRGNLQQSAASTTFVTGEASDYVGPSASMAIVSPLPSLVLKNHNEFPLRLAPASTGPATTVSPFGSASIGRSTR